MDFPPRRIVVPVDFSPAAKTGWQAAQALARRFGAALDAVYAEYLPPLAGPIGIVPEATRALRRQTQEELRQNLGPEGRLHLQAGDPLAVILGYCERLRPDLVVMGTHGRGGLGRLIHRSVTEAVVRLSPVPVLSICAPLGAITSVVCPVNFTEYAQEGLRSAAAVACAFGARLTALHVLEDGAGPRAAAAELARRLSALPFEVQERCRPLVDVQRGPVAAGILKAAPRHGLVVMMAHRKSLFDDIILGMTAERVLRHSPIPVLAIPARA